MISHRSVCTTGAVALIGLVQSGFAASARAADPTAYPAIVPSLTDPAIIDTPSPPPGMPATPALPGTRGNHLVWLARPERRVGKLLVFLPTGGFTNIPSEFTELGSVAGQLGYHTVSLAYRNEAPVAALPPAGCGPSAAKDLLNPTCSIDVRMEILTGQQPGSPLVNINEANSIENRLNKLLVYLYREHPADGWGEFIDDPDGPNPQPVWAKTVIAGASLGAGEAAIIASQHDVYRAALLHGWVDASHGWITAPIGLPGGTGKTPSTDYFTLIHARDNFFARTCESYRVLGLTPSCPLPGFTVPPALVVPTNPNFIENLGDPPFGRQIHVFNLAPGTTDGGGDIFHQSTTRNHWIAQKADGTPVDVLFNAWSSVLGDETDGDGIRNLTDNCPGISNVGQADADNDKIGDVCDPTPYGEIAPTIAVPPGITVGATGPAGAIVPYTVTATDDLLPAPDPVCAPSAGSLFAIGDTPVTCTATDLGGNTATESFVVTVRGADSQLADLRSAVDGIGPGNSLINKISSVQAALANSGVPGGCAILSAFVNEVGAQSGKKIPVGTAASLIADASRIQAILTC